LVHPGVPGHRLPAGWAELAGGLRAGRGRNGSKDKKETECVEYASRRYECVQDATSVSKTLTSVLTTPPSVSMNRMNTNGQVFLDIDCLQDGQSWLAGFVQGVVASMVFVPVCVEAHNLAT